MISPDLFRSLPCPTYPEIRLALARARGGRRACSTQFAPDAIHIATEGPLGLAARRWCLPHELPLHHRLSHPVSRLCREARRGCRPSWFWRYIRWFHRPARGDPGRRRAVVARELRAHGLDADAAAGAAASISTSFRPTSRRIRLFAALPRPIQLYVGRVAVEKNIEAFLAADHPGTQGGGRRRPGAAPRSRRAIREAHFLGALRGEALAAAYAGADVFVFPSRTDTFGLVMIEALACGTPVAAYPVPGPIDVLDARDRRDGRAI